MKWMQTIWLQLRYQTGWGKLAPEARRVATTCLLLVLGLLFITLSVLSLNTLGQGVHQDTRFLLRILVIGFLLLGQLLLLGMGMLRLRQAYQAQSGERNQIRGFCFAYLLGPSGGLRKRSLQDNLDDSDRQERPTEPILFAQIGSSKKAAVWFVLPAAWSSLLEDQGTELELEVLRGTQWVARLGSRDRFAELHWVATHLPGQYDHLSREEIKEIRRSLRRASTGWGSSAKQAQKAAGQLTEYGIVFSTLTIFSGVASFYFPPLRLFFLFVGLLGLVSVPLWWFAVYQFFHAWWVGRQAQATNVWIGRVVGVWPVWSAAFAKDEVHVLRVQHADEMSRCFTLGRTFRESLPEVGESISVTYLTKAEVVVQLEPISPNREEA